MMQEKSIPNPYLISPLFAEDSLVKAFQLLEKDEVLKMREERFSLRLQELHQLKDLSICFLRTYPDCLTTTKAGRFKQSSLHWMNWGMISCGKCVTAKISEFHSPERECILSDIIERNVEAKYYLSLKQIQKLLYKGYQAKKENAYIQLMGLALL